jgi:DNA repair exonuclease SbcCD ATPase subunit
MLFSTAKKIEELQAKLQAAIDENETLKANALTAQAELDRINATLETAKGKAEDEDDDEKVEEDYDDDEEMKKGKKANAKGPIGSAGPDGPVGSHGIEGIESPSAKVAALKANLDELTAKVAAFESSLESKVSAAVSATLAKIGIDPIHAGATADGTKPAAEKPKGRNGIERAGALLNEKIKAKQ